MGTDDDSRKRRALLRTFCGASWVPDVRPGITYMLPQDNEDSSPGMDPLGPRASGASTDIGIFRTTGFSGGCRRPECSHKVQSREGSIPERST